MVSEHDRRVFRQIGEIKNPPIQKVTRYQRLKAFDGVKYLQFLSDYIIFVQNLKKQKNENPDANPSTAIKFYEKAKKLGFIRS